MKRCRFCEIINENRINEEVVYENDAFIVLTDKFRKTSVGSIALVIPKKHRKNLLELTKSESQNIVEVVHIVSKAMQKAYCCKGIRIWTAVNKEAGQSIFHCHIHIVPCSSLKDRFIANFLGIYDLFNKILRRPKLSKSLNFELANKIRKAI